MSNFSNFLEFFIKVGGSLFIFPPYMPIVGVLFVLYIGVLLTFAYITTVCFTVLQ